MTEINESFDSQIKELIKTHGKLLSQPKSALRSSLGAEGVPLIPAPYASVTHRKGLTKWRRPSPAASETTGTQKCYTGDGQTGFSISSERPPILRKPTYSVAAVSVSGPTVSSVPAEHRVTSGEDGKTFPFPLFPSFSVSLPSPAPWPSTAFLLFLPAPFRIKCPLLPPHWRQTFDLRLVCEVRALPCRVAL